MVQFIFIMWIAGTYANDMDTKYRASFMLTFELSKLYVFNLYQFMLPFGERRATPWTDCQLVAG